MEKQPHIQLDEQAAATKAVVVGDPARVDKFKPHLSGAQDLAYNREFKSIAGTYAGERILVLSCGVGAPSAGIAVEELYNIGVRKIIRVGSAGAMQSGIDLGELIIGIGAVRDDGLSKQYVDIAFPAVPSPELLMAAKQLAPGAVYGVIRSHDGFYMDDNAETEAYWSSKGVVGADMESGILFTLGLLRGIETLSILNNVVLYQEDLSDGVNALAHGDDKVAKGELASIELALNILSRVK
ncbi:MAG: nucleoside phosphorylase [Clostridiales Family XIII bacterium]|jgi:uridine phosphorylase|nr:nucleoside phosphorylase [Clostridiales Family XIII bacterium]